MNEEQIRTLAADLHVRERTEKLCAMFGLNPAFHEAKCEMLMQEILDVAMEGWLSAVALGR